MMKQYIDKPEVLNRLTFQDYYTRLSIIAVSLFEWEGLPESVNQRYLEKVLFEEGKCLFFRDELMGFLTLGCAPSGELNVYQEPVSYTAISVNYSKTFSANESVLIRNNYEMLPTEFSMLLYAMRLTEAERTIDVNVKQQKTPSLILCDEKQRLTMKNLYHQYDGNSPVIFGDKNLSPDAIKSIKTDAPFIADKLMMYKRDIMNEAMTFLGINNANTDKKERLVVPEVESNNEMIQMYAETMLLTRKQACVEINKKYGLNVSVKLRNTEEYTPDEIEDNEEGGE